MRACGAKDLELGVVGSHVLRDQGSGFTGLVE